MKFPLLFGAYELDAVALVELMNMARTAIDKYFDPDLDEKRMKEVRAWQDEYRLLVANVLGKLGMDFKETEN